MKKTNAGTSRGPRRLHLGSREECVGLLLLGKVARVTYATVFMRGDLVRVRDARSWNDPSITPDDLELVYDSVNDTFLHPESNEELLSASDPEDRAAQLAFRRIDAAIDGELLEVEDELPNCDRRGEAA